MPTGRAGPSTAQQSRVVVVGGGLAGLAAARTLQVEQPALRVTVLEGSDRIGGKLRLGEVAGIPVDLGAESMLNRRPEGTDLTRAVGLEAQIVHPAATGAGVWTRGAVRPLPPTLMGIPADLDVVAGRGILGRFGVLRARMEPLLPRLEVREDVGIGRLVARRLGPELRDRLVEPLLGGVYAGRSDEISTYAALPKLAEAVQEHGSLVGAARALEDRGVEPTRTAEQSVPVFAGISGGVGRLPIAVAADIESRGGTILLDARVRELSRTATGWRVVHGPTIDPVAVDADAVVLATPAAPAARLLRPVVAAAALELGRMEYASMAVVTIAVDASAVDVELAGSGFLVPPVDGRLIKAVTYSSRKWGWLVGERSNTVVIRCSVGRHREEADLQRDDSDLVENAVLDLREATGLRARLLDARVTRWGGGLPQYAVGHLDQVARIQSALAGVPGLEVCGAAYDGVGIPAVVASGTAAATRVLSHLTAVATMGT